MQKKRLLSSFSVLLITALMPLFGRAQSTVCEILARNLTPDTFAQGSNSEKFSQIKRLVSDNTYDSFTNAQSSSFDGTLLSEYVDIFVKSKSDANNWGEHRRQFLSMSLDTEYASSANNVQISRMNVAALKEIVKCQQTYADRNGFAAVLEIVSDQRDSFAVLLTNRTNGSPEWKLTGFSAQPSDTGFNCDNDFHQASFQDPIRLRANSVRINCQKSPDAHFILSVQTSAGPAPTPFTLESVHEEIKQIREETAAKIQALKDRLDKPGVVAAFAATACPPPWTLYQPAVGRFVRGLDPNATIDPQGATRAFGSIQADGVGNHVHTMGVNGGDSDHMVGGGASQRLPNFVNDVYGGGLQKKTDTNTDSAGETRPKNVALLYCILN